MLVPKANTIKARLVWLLQVSGIETLHPNVGWMMNLIESHYFQVQKEDLTLTTITQTCAKSGVKHRRTSRYLFFNGEVHWCWKSRQEARATLGPLWCIEHWAKHHLCELQAQLIQAEHATKSSITQAGSLRTGKNHEGRGPCSHLDSSETWASGRLFSLFEMPTFAHIVYVIRLLSVSLCSKAFWVAEVSLICGTQKTGPLPSWLCKVSWQSGHSQFLQCPADQQSLFNLGNASNSFSPPSCKVLSGLMLATVIVHPA